MRNFGGPGLAKIAKKKPGLKECVCAYVCTCYENHTHRKAADGKFVKKPLSFQLCNQPEELPLGGQKSEH